MQATASGRSLSKRLPIRTEVTLIAKRAGLVTAPDLAHVANCPRLQRIPPVHARDHTATDAWRADTDTLEVYRAVLDVAQRNRCDK